MKISKWFKKWILIGLPLAFVGGFLLAQFSNYCDSHPTHCLKIRESGTVHPTQGTPFDIRKSAPLPYLNNKEITIRNHTGKILEQVIVCPSQTAPANCVSGYAYATVTNGSNLDNQTFSELLTIGFNGADNVPTDRRWHKLIFGEQTGASVNLKKDSNENYVDTNVYQSRPRKLFAPFKTEKELYKLAKRTQTSNHDLTFDSGTYAEQSCYGTPTSVGGVCLGNNSDCINQTTKSSCASIVEGGFKVCTWQSFCVGDTSCDGNNTSSSCTASQYPKTYPPANGLPALTVQVNCEWQPSDLGCSRLSDSSSCGGRTGCTWNESDNSGLEICIADQSINETVTVSESETATIGYQCGGTYDEPIEYCSGTYTTFSSSCTGDDYEKTAGFCGGTIAGIQTAEPPMIEPNIECAPFAQTVSDCGNISHLGCSWNNGENRCTGQFNIAQPMPNPTQFWLEGTACFNIATPENYGNLRSVGCSFDGTNYTGILTAPFARTDIPYNGGRCNNFGTDSISCGAISGCTWNEPIIESCEGKNQTVCNTDTDSHGDLACDWTTTSQSNNCSNQTSETPCLAQNSACEWNVSLQTINCPSFTSNEYNQSDCITNTGEFSNGNEACNWNPIFADEVEIQGCGAPEPQYKWVMDGWSSCTYAENEAVPNTNIGFYAPPTTCAVGSGSGSQQQSGGGSIGSVNMLELVLKYFRPQTTHAALIGGGGGSDGSYPAERPSFPTLCSPSQPLAGNAGSTAQKRTQNFKCVPVENPCSVGVDESLCLNSVGPKPIHEETCTVPSNDVQQFCSNSGCAVWNTSGTLYDSTNQCFVVESQIGCFGKPNVENIPACSGHSCYGKNALTCQNSENSQCCEFYPNFGN